MGLEIYSLTPDSTLPRGEEIQLWLDTNKQVEAFAIIDDDTQADVGSGYFRTYFDKGLTPAIADRVIAHLSSASASD